MQFKIWHLLAFVSLTGVAAYVFTQIGMNSARFEILKIDIHHDPQWGKHWSRIEWKTHLPSHMSGQEFTSFIEVDDQFETAGYKIGDTLRFRFREREFLNRPIQNPKKVLVDQIFSVDGNVLEDNGGDIFAGPYPTVKKDESEAEWE